LRAIIFANGELNHLPIDIRSDDCLIAVDGGAWHCLRLGLTPDIVLGDFDSFPEQERADLAFSGSEVISYPKRKDEIDLELALILAIERGAAEVLIYAALGARWDMTMANILLLAHPKLGGADIRIMDGPQEIRLIRAGEQVTLKGQPGDTVSLIPMQRDAHGITTTGLEYPINRGTLRFGKTQGVSNLLVETQGSVTLEDGSLLCVLIHQNKRINNNRLT
jgi:thiamine pyrophosphokinase